jgi:integration host factor subunit alpha
MTLTKADIVARVYALGQFNKSEAANAVERSLELIKNALASEEMVLISGFGKWSVRAKNERRGRNPQTGEPLILPSRKVVTFRPSRVLKAKIQGQGGASSNDASAGPQQSQDGNGGKVVRPGYF